MRLSSGCREAREVLAGAFFSSSTLLHSGLEQPLVQAVHGCCLSVLEAYGRISCSTWSPRRAVRTWNLCIISVSLCLAVIVPGV